MKNTNPSAVAAANETDIDEVVIDGQSQAESNGSQTVVDQCHNQSMQSLSPSMTIASINNCRAASIEISNQQNENLELDDLPTFDEALKMEVVENSQDKLRRRFSSRVSMQSDELPDYESVSYETYITTQKPNQ